MYKLIAFFMFLAMAFAAPAPEPEPGAILAPGLAPAIYKAPLYPAPAAAYPAYPANYPAYPPLTYGAPLVYPYPALAYSKIY